jgi:hypothetical protein
MHNAAKEKNMKEVDRAMAASSPARRPNKYAVQEPVRATVPSAANIDGILAAKWLTPSVLKAAIISQYVRIGLSKNGCA